MLRAANIVLTPETVATYLAQMWISNIMQTVGWGLVASFFSTANGRWEIFIILTIIPIILHGDKVQL